MSTERFGRGHAISGAFVFLLLGVFAVFSTVMVLLGAQLYRGTVEQTDLHNARRVGENYLMSVVRANDRADTVSVRQEGDGSVLVFAWDDGEMVFETMIYCHDGMLRELFTESTEGFTPEYGEAICKADHFEAELDGRLLTMALTGADGGTRVLHAALRCGQETSMGVTQP